MKIFLVADKKENVMDRYKTLAKAFAEAEIVLFVPEKDFEYYTKLKTYKNNDIIIYHDNKSKSFDAYIAEIEYNDDTLFIYSSIELSTAILAQIKLAINTKKKSVFIKNKKPNFIKKIFTPIYNLCVNFFVGHHDSLADPRIVYISKKQLAKLEPYGTKLRVVKDAIDIGDSTIIYTPIPPIRTHISRATLINTALLLCTAIILSLNAFITISVVLNIFLLLILIALIVLQTIFISRDIFDSRINL